MPHTNGQGKFTAEALARLIRMCPDYERRVIVLATQGRDAADIGKIMGYKTETIQATMDVMLPQLRLDSWTAGMFGTRQVRRALEQARLRAKFPPAPSAGTTRGEGSPTSLLAGSILLVSYVGAQRS